MKIQYLGTSAAEGIPAIFCQCEICQKSRRAGGRNIRSRSQALIDGKILIDLPADTYMHSVLYNIDLSKIKTCIITHDHGDHLYPLEIANRRPGFAYFDGEEFPLNIYCTHPAYVKLAEVQLMTREDENNRIALHKIKAFQTIHAEGYEITSLKANHAEKCEPVFYMIRKDDQAILYAHDTAIFPDETWDYLSKLNVKFNLVSLDCTFAMRTGQTGHHMSLESNAIVRDRLCDMGLVDEKTIFIANHFTHNGYGTYDQIKEAADKIDFITSYDGLTVEF